MNPAPPDPNEAKYKGIDYGREIDIARVHTAVMREKSEPKDGNEPLSLWFVTLFGVVLFAGGAYLMMFGGGFKWDVYSPYEGTAFGPPGGAAKDVKEVAPPKEPTLMEIGEKVYRRNCLACHQASGLGVAGAFPPLVGSDWVTGGEKRVAAILLHGILGEFTVNGVKYIGAMPAWNQLTDKEIAGVITYTRQSWGNQGSELTPDQIAAAREEFADRKTQWTEAELLEIPPDAGLPRAEPEP